MPDEGMSSRAAALTIKHLMRHPVAVPLDEQAYELGKAVNGNPVEFDHVQQIMTAI